VKSVENQQLERSNKHKKTKTKNERTQSMVKKMYRRKRMPMCTDEWID